MTYKNKILLLAAAAITVLNFQSCSKYEDGPAFSLRTKKGRLVGTWEVVKVNGQNISSYSGYNVDMEWEFESDGDFKVKQTISYSNGGYGNNSYSYSSSGEWEWENNKEEIEIKVNGQVLDLEIKQLTSNEMKLDMDYYTSTEYEFEKVN
jgi:hypothetical protein